MPGTPNAEKTAAVDDIAESFRGSSAAVLTEYRGLTVTEVTELRRALGAGTRYAVVKNTLTKIAAVQAGVEGLAEMLAGPTAIAFVQGDPVEAAKGLRDFARTHPLLVVKGGVLDGRPLSPADITKLADLESREVLLASLAGALKASLSQAVGLFAAPLAQVARLAAALEAKAQMDGTDTAVAADAPVADGADTPVVADSADTPAAPEIVADALAPQPDASGAGIDDAPADTPAADTPAADTPAADTPAAEAPAAEVPTEVTSDSTLDAGSASDVVADAVAPQPEADTAPADQAADSLTDDPTD